jgi:hypothetical protein
MLNQSAFAHPAITTMATPATGSRCAEFDEILALAHDAGMLITLDGQIGREKYQSIAGSLTSFRRFTEALLTTVAA